MFLLGSGDGFDVINLLQGQSTELLFEAVDSVELLSIPVEKAREWIFLHPEFNRTFFPYLGYLMGKLGLLSTDLALHDTETRLARLILSACESSFTLQEYKGRHDATYVMLQRI